jgi:hypothetical protein
MTKTSSAGEIMVQDMLPDPEIRAGSRELLAQAVRARTPTGSSHPQINVS